MSKSKRAFGDFQTPMPLVESIVSLLKSLGIGANRVLEPTCGRGNFIHGLLNAGAPPAEIVGVEISQEYVAQARLIAGENGDVRILQANIFDMDFGHDLSWQKDGDLLVVGNPPWVTNAALGLLESDNLPAKRNLKNLPGIDALTGASNFDLAEAIWIKLIRELYDQKPVIALLCKTSVARNVLQYVRRHQIAITNASIRLIDAGHWFNAAVDACLFMMSVNRGETCYEVEVYESLSTSQPQSRMGFIGSLLIPDIKQYAELQDIDGKSPYIWRQGIKHDSASVMELIDCDGNWYNALDERVEIEETYLYPLLKSSDVRPSQRKFVKRAVIVPQRYVGENTWMLRQEAPKLWQYLNHHAERFELRKSSIYKGKPPFSVFGVGSYTFSPYKVCVSGLYKMPYFKAVGLRDGRPFVCDDTCYLLPFNSASQAARTAAALNHPITIRFLNSITFWDSKRPITKGLLSRINLDALIERLPEPDIRHRTEKILDELAANGEIETLESAVMESPAQLRLL